VQALMCLRTSSDYFLTQHW